MHAKGSLRPFHLSFPTPLPSASKSSLSRRTPNFHPRLKLSRSCGCDIDSLLKIIYIYFFSLIRFYTGYTLLPNNTINRCFLPLLLPRPPFLFDLDARRSRTKMTIDNDFCSRPLSLFWKIATTRRSPPPSRGIPKGPTTLLRFVPHVLAAGGKDTARHILPKSRTSDSASPLSTPPSSHLRITYIRLFSREKHTRVVKPLKSKNHNVFGTQASESFTSSDQSMDNQSMMTDSDNDIMLMITRGVSPLYDISCAVFTRR